MIWMTTKVTLSLVVSQSGGFGFPNPLFISVGMTPINGQSFDCDIKIRRKSRPPKGQSSHAPNPAPGRRN